MYDQFKVKTVTVTFRPSFGQLSTTATAANYNTYFHSILDFDSPVSASFSRGQIQQYRNMRRTPLNRVHSRTWHPKALGAQYVFDNTGSQVLTYKPVDGWFDLATTPQFMNLYTYVDPMLADTPIDSIDYNVEITAHVVCKNVR